MIIKIYSFIKTLTPLYTIYIWKWWWFPLEGYRYPWWIITWSYPGNFKTYWNEGMQEWPDAELLEMVKYKLLKKKHRNKAVHKSKKTKYLAVRLLKSETVIRFSTTGFLHCFFLYIFCAAWIWFIPTIGPIPVDTGASIVARWPWHASLTIFQCILLQYSCCTGNREPFRWPTGHILKELPPAKTA